MVDSSVRTCVRVCMWVFFGLVGMAIPLEFNSPSSSNRKPSQVAATGNPTHWLSQPFRYYNSSTISTYGWFVDSSSILFFRGENREHPKTCQLVMSPHT